MAECADDWNKHIHIYAGRKRRDFYGGEMVSEIHCEVDSAHSISISKLDLNSHTSPPPPPLTLVLISGYYYSEVSITLSVSEFFIGNFIFGGFFGIVRIIRSYFNRSELTTPKRIFPTTEHRVDYFLNC